MQKMTATAHAKVSLALDILHKNTSGNFIGYHTLQTVRQLIDLHDTITITPASHTTITCTDPAVPTDQRNSCYRAWELLKSNYAGDPSVHIAIEKRIPSGGGLAGGAANGAAVLQSLNQLWNLNLSSAALAKIGQKIGIDIPFFFAGATTALDRETTLEITPIKTSLSFFYILVFPNFASPTVAAYKNLDYATIGKDQKKTDALIAALEAGERDGVIENIHNDFEVSLLRDYPALEEIKDALLTAGAEAAFLTGSGSTVIGIARDDTHARALCKKTSLPQRCCAYEEK